VWPRQGILSAILIAGLNLNAAAIAAPEVVPRQAFALGVGTEDLKATYDVALARQQVAAYPNSPDAHFILAVALTRTSYVEEALNEVRRARRLAESCGGPSYFDKMISAYEELLKTYPEEDQVRYELAWAYYMKSYLVSSHYQRIHKLAHNPNTQSNGHQSPDLPWELAAVTKAGGDSELDQAKKYYEASLKKLDELLAKNPLDAWAQIYRAFLKAQYTGDIDSAMNTWNSCLKQFPDNPLPYFFLGEGYLKKGNLKESLRNVSKAISLRAGTTP